MQMRGVPVSAPVSLGKISAGRTVPRGRRQLADRPLLRAADRATAGASGTRHSSSRRSSSARTGSRLCSRRTPGRPTTSATTTATVMATPGTPRRGHFTARLYRPFLNRGVPPHFRSYDLYFLHWLSRTGKQVDILSQAELDAIRDPAIAAQGLRRAHLPRSSRIRDRAASTTRSRDSATEAGSLVFLSANNFFWRIDHRERRDDPGREVARTGSSGGRSPRRPVHRERYGRASRAMAPAQRARDAVGSSPAPARRPARPSRMRVSRSITPPPARPAARRSSARFQTCSAPD